MRRFFFYGLALAAGCALTTASYAQQLFEQGGTRWMRNGSLFGNNTGYRIQEGAPTQATPPATLQDPAVVQPAPVDAAAGDKAAEGAASYNNYFDCQSEAACGCAPSANWVVGVYGLVMRRDYEDDVGLSYDPTNPTGLYESSANWGRGSMGGVEAVIARRGCSGNGFEVRYWGLYPEACGCGTGYAADTALGGLSQVNFGGGTALDAFNAADTHTFYRNNEFQNLEFNLLHCGGSANCGRTNWEWLAGFRYFYFNEDFSYGAEGTDPAFPNPVYYDLVTTNHLYGFQLGGRTEHFVTQRFGLQLGTTIGLFGNHIEATQSINDRFGNFGTVGSGPDAGLNYAYGNSKDDFAMGASLRVGGIYQFAERWRVVGGYQGFAVSGVALAPEQIPYNFTDSGEIQRIDSNSGVILHGAYFGVEHSF